MQRAPRLVPRYRSVDLANSGLGVVERAQDPLRAVSEAQEWLAANGFMAVSENAGAAPSLVQADEQWLAELITVRQAMLAVAEYAQPDARPDPPMKPFQHLPDLRSAASTLNRWAKVAPHYPVLNIDGTLDISDAATDPGRQLIADLAREFLTLLGRSDNPVLRLCGAPRCKKYFVRDTDRRQWCSAPCGNRARVARHYAEHHGHHRNQQPSEGSS